MTLESKAIKFNKGLIWSARLNCLDSMRIGEECELYYNLLNLLKSIVHI